jgi:hypothetical protein
MESLTPTIATGTYSSTYTNTTSNSSGLQLNLPNPQVNIPKPLSYEFRVVESWSGDKLVKVGLQVQVTEHDAYGYGLIKRPWADVPRFKLDVATGITIQL